MKKSQLRKIIRESIREHVSPFGMQHTHGGVPQGDPKRVYFQPCQYPQMQPVTIDRTRKMTIDNQTPTPGDIFSIDLGPQDGFWNPSMNGAFVPMRVAMVMNPQIGFPLGNQTTLDFDSSHCKTAGDPIPNDPITHAKVAQGGGRTADGYINKIK